MDLRTSLTMRRGDTLFFLGQVYTNPLTGEVASGPQNSPPPGWVAYNLTGARLWFTAKNWVSDPDAAAVAQLDNLALGGVVFTTALAGQYSVTMPPSATQGYGDGPVPVPYDLQLKDTSGRIFTVESGVLTVSPDVTRATT